MNKSSDVHLWRYLGCVLSCVWMGYVDIYTRYVNIWTEHDCVQMVPWLSVWSEEWYEDTFTVFSVLYGHDMVSYEKDVWCHVSVCVKWGVIWRYINCLFSCVWTKHVDMWNRRDIVHIWCHNSVCVKWWGVMWRYLNCLFSCVGTKHVDVWNRRDVVHIWCHDVVCVKWGVWYEDTSTVFSVVYE